MTKEMAIHNLYALKQRTRALSNHEALDMAIKALEQQPSDDCISRKVVKESLRTEWVKYIPIELDVNLSFVLSKIDELPSVIPSYNSIKTELEQTIPKGKWIILDECANEGVYCSECHKKVFKLEFRPTMKWRNFKYCPNCGAEMEIENEKETC